MKTIEDMKLELLSDNSNKFMQTLIDYDNRYRILQNIEVLMQEQSCENFIHKKKITFTNLIVN